MIFWSFLVLLSLIVVLVFLGRHRLMTWGWNIALIAVFLYVGLFKMTGTARDAWLFSTIEQVHGDVEVVYSQVVQKRIYLLVQSKPGEIPYYLTIAWNRQTEQELNKAKMEAERRGGALLANADFLSRWTIQLEDPNKDGGRGSGKTDNANGDSIPVAKGETPKQGGEKMFYPRPMPPDPLKQYKTILQDPDRPDNK